ncbi:TPA: 50S ribosomal protein L24 [Candidatus Gracilibacteria bacterium]|nr:50S ribosomal protein L24 [Candidatus Gracilibacteria bacterium]HIQ57435.1 50S ribosomal protein L24 [Candidatus Gracilibacteria bacterium]
MRIKVGDEVVIISGKDNGKKGVVINLNSSKATVTVKDVNIMVKHIKKTAEQAGERIKKEAPLSVSNVMILDSEGNASRIKYSLDKNGKKIREFVTTSKVISENFTKS